MLDEQPKTVYTPDFFTTQMGVEAGLTAPYAQLRYLYGNAYYYNIMTTGTDEATYGASADVNFKSADLSGAEALLPNNANSQNLWGRHSPVSLPPPAQDRRSATASGSGRCLQDKSSRDSEDAGGGRRPNEATRSEFRRDGLPVGVKSPLMHYILA